MSPQITTPHKRIPHKRPTLTKGPLKPNNTRPLFVFLKADSRLKATIYPSEESNQDMLSELSGKNTIIEL